MMTLTELVLLAHNQLEDEARADTEEREAVRGMTDPPHYELNDGTCVSCGRSWPCGAWEQS